MKYRSDIQEANLIAGKKPNSSNWGDETESNVLIFENYPISNLYKPTSESTFNFKKIFFLSVEIVLVLTPSLSAMIVVATPPKISNATSLSLGLNLLIFAVSPIDIIKF